MSNKQIVYIFRVSLMLNGEAVTSIGGTNNTSASNSIILPLNRGDRVYLELNSGCLIELYDSSYRYSRQKLGYVKISDYFFIQYISIYHNYPFSDPLVWQHFQGTKLVMALRNLEMEVGVVLEMVEGELLEMKSLMIMMMR